jgi:hypothetical protein
LVAVVVVVVVAMMVAAVVVVLVAKAGEQAMASMVSRSSPSQDS